MLILFLYFWPFAFLLYAEIFPANKMIAALEPFFNAAASQFILGQQVPLTLWLSLAPVVIGNLIMPFACVPSSTSLVS